MQGRWNILYFGKFPGIPAVSLVRNIIQEQANWGFTRSQLCSKEDGTTINLVLYNMVRYDISKKGGNAQRGAGAME